MEEYTMGPRVGNLVKLFLAFLQGSPSPPFFFPFPFYLSFPFLPFPLFPLLPSFPTSFPFLPFTLSFSPSFLSSLPSPLSSLLFSPLPSAFPFSLISGCIRILPVFWGLRSLHRFSSGLWFCRLVTLSIMTTHCLWMESKRNMAPTMRKTI